MSQDKLCDTKGFGQGAFTMRRPTIKERAENLARFLTKRTKSKKWCKCINTAILDIRYREVDPIAQLSCGNFDRGYREVDLVPQSDEAIELGLFPYASLLTPEGEHEAELLNTALKAMIELRQVQYGRTPPRKVKWSRRNGKRVKRKR
ncbi:MAG TPA: hypothetical protein VHD38_03765 [Candidatus Paceibacterota bacterium]|nr:hypothetical protein [Candidatus Paceibacterota bacterium]